MKFGHIELENADGALLAHSIKLDGLALKKGHMLTAVDIDALLDRGQQQVVAAVLEPGDVHEDAAATALAKQLFSPGSISISKAFTGRCNLIAERDGLLSVEEAVIDVINAEHESVTVATLPSLTRVAARQLLATVKVIPFAVAGDVLERCIAHASHASALALHQYVPRQVVLIQTRLPQTADKLLAKTEQVTEARLNLLGMHLVQTSECAHDIGALRSALQDVDAGADIVLIAGASAIVDRRDVIPAAIEAADGEVHHFGMPVDPGNLILLGALRHHTVLGLPGCARSPKFNGLDMVLERLSVGLEVSPQIIQRMGAGGLLKEIASRPMPRRSGQELGQGKRAKVAAILLAAGQSRRMGKLNKLLADVAGQPMLGIAVKALLSAPIDEVIIVTGYEHDAVMAMLDRELDDASRVRIIDNPQYAQGLSSSLRCGLNAIDDTIDGVLVCLADMPAVTAAHISNVVAAFSPQDGREICVPTFEGKRGNPVLFARRFIDDMKRLRGDVGARHLIGENEEVVYDVALHSDAVLTDLDSQEALERFNDAMR